ncbi:MAG: hypothetical protein QJR09_13060 [Micrococcus sp.]|nr:hypothetical protein [Micrococcus sp.]
MTGPPDGGAWATLKGPVDVGIGACSVTGTATTMAAAAEDVEAAASAHPEAGLAALTEAHGEARGERRDDVAE